MTGSIDLQLNNGVASVTTQTEIETKNRLSTETIDKNKVNLAQGCEPVDAAAENSEKVNKTQTNRIAEYLI